MINLTEDEKHVSIGGVSCHPFVGGFGSTDVLSKIEDAKQRVWIQDASLCGFDPMKLFDVLTRAVSRKVDVRLLFCDGDELLIEKLGDLRRCTRLFQSVMSSAIVRVDDFAYWIQLEEGKRSSECVGFQGPFEASDCFEKNWENSHRFLSDEFHPET